MMLKKRSMNRELSEPLIGLAVGVIMLIVACLIAHFVFGLAFFS
ncbi:hypothetical protein ACFFHM_10425 [Halalkalibacter kiskunsagensis]|uniref:Uncharacterized protein n=1 Tax=Halalkalibacter kiskunsagensis TaxID=1548599 RepID=A0ABV6KC55_9BACI